MGGWLAGGGWGWLENLILMKTQASAQTWTWTLDFDLGFVKKKFLLAMIVVCRTIAGVANVAKCKK